MCCSILAGIVQNPQVETNMCISKEIMEDIKNLRLFQNNFGVEKAFPSGQTCRFRGK